MDAERFDDLARSFAAASSRREALRALAGLAAAGVLGLLGLGEAEAAGQKRQRPPRQRKAKQKKQAPPTRPSTAMRCLPYGEEFQCGDGCCNAALYNMCCEGRCVDSLKDPNNCGGCARPAPPAFGLPGQQGGRACPPQATC